MIYGLNDLWPITIFPSVISTGPGANATTETCTLQVVAGSLDVNLRWLLLSPRFHFGTLLQRVLWSKLSERQRGERAKEGEMERERERENRENLSAPKYERGSALPHNKGGGAHQTVLSTPAAFCQTVLTSQSNALLFYSFHSASAARGLLRDNWLYHDLDKATS